MNLFTGYFLPCFYAFMACLSFSLLYNVHGIGMVICSLGGTLGWFVNLLLAPWVQDELLQFFCAAIVISIYSEVMARIRKCPVTGYLVVAFFPLVPGGGIYYTMEHAMNGDTALFLETFLHTLGLAGALALGVLLVSSLVRIINSYQRRRALQKGTH